MYAIGQSFIVVNGQTRIHNLPIWSHCRNEQQQQQEIIERTTLKSDQTKNLQFRKFFLSALATKIFTIVPLSSLCADVDWANFFSMLDGAMTSPRSASLWKAHGHDWQNGAIDWVQGLENCANRASRFRGNTLAHARCCSLAASVTRWLGYLQQRKFTLKQKKCTKVRSTFCQITPKISPKMLIIFCQSGEICQIWSHLSLSISVLDSLFHSWLLSLSLPEWPDWVILNRLGNKFSYKSGPKI